MRRSTALTLVLLTMLVASCSSKDDDAAVPGPTKTSAPAAATAKPTASGRTHELRVTIRDEPNRRQAFPKTEGDTCSWPEPDIGPQLVVTDATTEDNSELASFDTPLSGRLLDNGTCTVKMSVEVPYAKKYELGLGVEGQGISVPETDPPPTIVTTKGDSQDVVLVY